jgi:peptidoglycan/LPS O-acetylase OafA/YrhL
MSSCAPVSPSASRVYGLDLLRSLAVSLVFFYHLPIPHQWRASRAMTHFGWTGVDLFFVLSGYLIAGQLLQARQRGSMSLKVFYLRRFMRTLPCYFVCLPVYLLIENAPTRGFGIGPILKYGLFLQNFGVPPFFSISWSLCVEEHFYLIFPLIAAALYRFGRGATPVAATFAFVAAAGLVIRALVWFKHPILPGMVPAIEWENYLGQIYYPTYNRLDGLMVGVGLAAIRIYRPDTWKRCLRHANLCLLSGALVLLSAFVLLMRQFSLSSCVFGFPLLAIGFGLVLISSVASDSLLNRVRVPGASHLALLAYSIYITHPLSVGWASKASQQLGWGINGTLGLSFLVTYGVARILYSTVENPCLKLRDRVLPMKFVPRLEPSLAVPGSQS